MWDIYRMVLHEIDGFSMRDWMVVFACAVFVGILCLRGFGSRSSY